MGNRNIRAIQPNHLYIFEPVHYSAFMGRRIWPIAYRNIGSMIESSVIVKAACPGCGHFFDVDLEATRTRRGPEKSIINARPRCRIATCRTDGFFIVSPSAEVPFQVLADSPPENLKLDALRPIDLEPPDPESGIAAVMGKIAAGDHL